MKKIIATLTVFILCDLASAGMPNGPYLAWIASGSKGAEATATISRYFTAREKKEDFCGDVARGPILVVRTLPPGLDEDLVERGIWRGDKEALSKIRTIMSEYRLSPESESLDGVIAFRTIDKEWGEMASLGVGSSKIRKRKISAAEPPSSLVDSFCALMPPILRR